MAAPANDYKPSLRSVSNIKKNLLRPATTSHFEVRIGLPMLVLPPNNKENILGSVLKKFLDGTRQEQLNLMCSETVLPGSQLATTEVFNDFTGVTERHAYRRIYDETIDLTFYVDAQNYLPIVFFEEWINGILIENQDDADSPQYSYRSRYPNEYVSELKVIKFEKDYHTQTNDIKMTTGARSYEARRGSGTSLEYTFIRAFPRSITSMPVSYDGSSLLKCSVQMNYMRYLLHHRAGVAPPGNVSPVEQSKFNIGGFLDGVRSNLVGQVRDQVTSGITDKIEASWGGGLPLGANDLSGTLSNIA